MAPSSPNQPVDPDLLELERAIRELLATLKTGPTQGGVEAVQALLPRLATLAAIFEQRPSDPPTRDVLSRLRPFLRACERSARDWLDWLELEQQLLGLGKLAGEEPTRAVDRLA